MDSPKKKVRIRLEYKVQYHNPIQVKAGDSVQVGRAESDYPGWLWCRSADGGEGWIAAELLSVQGGQCVVLRDYSAKELAVQVGDEVEIEEVCHGWGLVRNDRGELGWIPESHIDM